MYGWEKVDGVLIENATEQKILRKIRKMNN